MLQKTLFIIDGSSCIYRAYHAIPHFTTSKGFPTNAVYGFTQTLRKILKGYSPDYIAVAFDTKGPSFRHELFEEYKIERPAMPDDLSLQIPYIKMVVDAFNIPALERTGFEADDIIGTLAKKYAGAGIKVVIVTGDKDMLQLVGDHTVVLDYTRDREYGSREIEKRFGVEPCHMVDLIALAGDASDNIPGVPGIGPKTAAKLIGRFGSLEEIYNNIDKVSPERIRRILDAHRDAAMLSKRLATLDCNVPVEVELETLEYSGPDFDKLESVFRELEFSRLIKELIPARKEDGSFDVISGEADLEALVDRLLRERVVAVTLEREGGAVEGRILGFGFRSDNINACCVPVDGPGERGLSEDAASVLLKGIMENGQVEKATDDAKALYIHCMRRGIRLAGVMMDVAIASYLLNPTQPSHRLEDVAYTYLGTRLLQPEDHSRSDYSIAKRADAVFELTPVLGDMLEKEGLSDLFRNMELPLSEVLAAMELRGMKLDRQRLEKLSEEIKSELAALEKSLHEAAGYSFNINSPKQLSRLLFDELGLKPVKRTKTGFSTDESVLSALAAEHPIPREIIRYRRLSKLKSTYVDSLLALADPATDRIHTSFNQTVTATGRLSSSNPNLQNIPVRGRYAGRIREAFVAERGYVLLAADYSQIELRIVAHLSGDPVLTDAFKKGEDVHTRTASEVFGVAPELVTPEMRRRAKAINFGIIYGMGPHGLAVELDITMKDAKEYIDTYFRHYRSVKEFVDRTIEEAKRRGYTETIFGRRRYIPELYGPTDQVVRLGERMAVNTPIQGSAADMIKAAMIAIYRRLEDGGYTSKMILQIHDELVFEVLNDELADIKDIVKDGMEGVASLKVPVVVNITTGRNWYEAGLGAKKP